MHNPAPAGGLTVQTLRRRGAAAALGAGLLTAAGIAHQRASADWTLTGLALPLDRLFDLSFTGAFLLLAYALGRRLLRAAPAPKLDEGEGFMVAAALGLGALAYGVLGLGLLHLLHPPLILGLAAALALALRRDLVEAVKLAAQAVAQFDADLRARTPSRFALALSGILAALLLLIVAKALTPPTGPDALGYHLAAPQLFLNSGGIQRIPLMPRADLPLTVEMLYMVGLAAKTDTFAQLLHAAFGLLTALAAGLLARRWQPGAGWLAAAAVLATPAVAIMAAWAYIDLGWTFFEVAALYGFFRWWETGDRRWLALGGVPLGFALGSKYLGLHLVVALPPLMALRTLRRREPLGALVRDGAALFLPALLVAAPWYLKNALWTGNPVYPFFDEVFRQGVTQGLAQSTAVLQGTPIGQGPQRSGLDYLLLPLRVMTEPQSFTGNHTPSAFGQMLLLLPLGLLVRWPRVALPAGAVTALLLALWAAGPQETRYALPAAVLLCALAAVTLARLLARYRALPLLRCAVQATVLALALLTVHHQIASGFGGWSRGALLHLAGLESRDRYLEGASWLYGGMRYLRQRLPPGATVLFLGDSGGYYAPVRYIQDDALAPLWLLPQPGGYAYPLALSNPPGPALSGVWTVERAATMGAALDALRRQDVQYLFLSYIYAEGLTSGELKEARRRRTEELQSLWRAGALELAYADQYCAVLRITDRAERSAAATSPPPANGRRGAVHGRGLDWAPGAADRWRAAGGAG